MSRQRAFNSLSRDHKRDEKMIEDIRWVPFNSLSRDHQHLVHRCRKLEGGNFQLPLSGSLGARQASSNSARASFNSLSRDHRSSLRDSCGCLTRSLSTPSLGITDHYPPTLPVERTAGLSTPSLGITSGGSCSRGSAFGPRRFQLPLSGSHTTVLFVRA